MKHIISCIAVEYYTMFLEQFRLSCLLNGKGKEKEKHHIDFIRVNVVEWLEWNSKFESSLSHGIWARDFISVSPTVHHSAFETIISGAVELYMPL